MMKMTCGTKNMEVITNPQISNDKIVVGKNIIENKKELLIFPNKFASKWMLMGVK